MKTLKAKPGIEIGDAADWAVNQAREAGEPIVLEFNGTKILVGPQSEPLLIVQEWANLRAAMQASPFPEGIGDIFNRRASDGELHAFAPPASSGPDWFDKALAQWIELADRMIGRSLTVRDRFALGALQGNVAYVTWNSALGRSNDREQIAENAYLLADAMMWQRDQPDEPGPDIAAGKQMEIERLRSWLGRISTASGYNVPTLKNMARQALAGEGADAVPEIIPNAGP